MASDGNSDYSCAVGIFLTLECGKSFQADSQLESGKGC